MNKLDQKLLELADITDNNQLLEEVRIFLTKLQKDFNNAILSKDADIYILANTVQKNTEQIDSTKWVHDRAKTKTKLKCKAVIEYLERKLNDIQRTKDS